MSSGTGAIGLTSFYTLPGTCDQTKLCDFESGPCNWRTNVTNVSANYQFKLIRAGDAQWQSDVPGNNMDHSTESVNGHFMEANGGQTIDITILS